MFCAQAPCAIRVKSAAPASSLFMSRSFLHCGVSGRTLVLARKPGYPPGSIPKTPRQNGTPAPVPFVAEYLFHFPRSGSSGNFTLSCRRNAQPLAHERHAPADRLRRVGQRLHLRRERLERQEAVITAVVERARTARGCRAGRPPSTSPRCASRMSAAASPGRRRRRCARARCAPGKSRASPATRWWNVSCTSRNTSSPADRPRSPRPPPPWSAASRSRSRAARRGRRGAASARIGRSPSSAGGSRSGCVPSLVGTSTSASAPQAWA